MLLDFEFCGKCNDAPNGLCKDVNNCTDFVNLLIALQPHYSGIRTLIRKIYGLRRLNFLGLELEALLMAGDWRKLKVQI